MYSFHQSTRIAWLLVSVANIFLKLSQYSENVIFSFIATSQCFGSIGGGTLFLLKLNENGSINKVKSFNWTDGLFDIVRNILSSIVY